MGERKYSDSSVTGVILVWILHEEKQKQLSGPWGRWGKCDSEPCVGTAVLMAHFLRVNVTSLMGRRVSWFSVDTSYLRKGAVS